MRTEGQLANYIRTTSYGLFNIAESTPGEPVVYFNAMNKGILNEDVILNVDNQLIACWKVLHITADNRLFRDVSRDTAYDSHASVEIVCKTIQPAPWLPYLERQDLGYSLQRSTTIVLQWRDRPCLSLISEHATTDFHRPRLFFSENGLTYLFVRGRWLEFHDYVVGHEIQIREHNEN